MKVLQAAVFTAAKGDRVQLHQKLQKQAAFHDGQPAKVGVRFTK